MQLAPATLPIDPSRSAAPGAVLPVAGLPASAAPLNPGADDAVGLFSALLGETGPARPAAIAPSAPAPLTGPGARCAAATPKPPGEGTPSSDQLAAAAWSGWMPAAASAAAPTAPGLTADGQPSADDPDATEQEIDASLPGQSPRLAGPSSGRPALPGAPAVALFCPARFTVTPPSTDAAVGSSVTTSSESQAEPDSGEEPQAAGWGSPPPGRNTVATGPFPGRPATDSGPTFHSPSRAALLPDVTQPADPGAVPLPVAPAQPSNSEPQQTTAALPESPAAEAQVAATVPGEPAPLRPSSGRAEPSRPARRTDRENPAGATPVNIAAFSRPDFTRAVSAVDVAEKKILSVDEREVTKPTERLGIDAAKSAPAMSNSTSNHSVTAPVTVSPLAGRAAEVTSAAPSDLPAASQAERAVATVLATAERLHATSQSSVHLKLAVGDADLSVKIELRGGEIHTVFRTDSGDLRSALSVAWQSVDAEAARGVRLADPVIAPATVPGADTHLGHDAGGQSGARRETDPGASLPAAWRPAPTAPASTPASFESRPTLRPDLNLYAFA